MARLQGLAALAMLVLVSAGFAGENERLNEWQQDDAFVVTDTPADFDPAKPTLLVIYALPNGSTVEQTMGAKLKPGMDWHYDIQHIAAQTRKLRQIDQSRNIVVAYVEAQSKSYKLTWPTWRADQRAAATRASKVPTTSTSSAKNNYDGKVIRGIVDAIVKSVPAKDVKVDLVAHSGGGTFIFGFLNGGESITANIERIAWIDANYAYDNENEHHGEKLLAWLRADRSRHLVVIAYNDRAATLNGKPFVSETGGTFYRSHRMVEFFRANGAIERRDHEPFEDYFAMGGQVHFLLHTNPEKKILHTVLVERNGFLEALTWDTLLHDKWGGTFWGARAYSDLIEDAVVLKTRRSATATSSAKPQASGEISARANGALGGKSFCETIADLPASARENAVVAEIMKGNVPAFQRKFVEIRVKNDRHEIVYSVIPDYLAIGSDADFVRMPMTPASASQIAKAFGCVLPTRLMVDQIYQQAAVKVEPRPLTVEREAVRTFVQHNAIVSSQLAGKALGVLVAGDKKDIVLSNKLKDHPKSVVIYGWHQLDGKPIQPLYAGHANFYADYSHGVRLVRDACVVDGKADFLSRVMRHAELSSLVSDEGPIEVGY